MARRRDAAGPWRALHVLDPPPHPTTTLREACHLLGWRACSLDYWRLDYGEWRELDFAVQHIARANPGAPIILVGFSAGTHLVLRYLQVPLDMAPFVNSYISMTHPVCTIRYFLHQYAAPHATLPQMSSRAACVFGRHDIQFEFDIIRYYCRLPGLVVTL